MEKFQFFDQIHELTLLIKSQVLDLSKSLFLKFINVFFFVLEKHFFFLEYCQTHFPGIFSQRERGGKFLLFWLKPWSNLFGNVTIFKFLNSLFYSVEKLFIFLEYHLAYFPDLLYLKTTWKIFNF